LLKKKHYYGHKDTIDIDKQLFLKKDRNSRGPGTEAASALSPRKPLGAPPPDPVKVMTAKVEQKSASATSVIFKIDRKTTIKHDNEPHKVAITIIKLKEGEFKYTIHPSLCQKAFLRAIVKNTSAFPLLPGPTKIFFGNNFNCVTKIEKGASPGEKFTINLGTDPSISVIYKPCHKFIEESGFINKTSIQHYEYEALIKNSKRIKIHVKMRDQLPQSTTDVIKVKLQEPDLRNQHTVELQKDNNLKWKLQIPPGQESKIRFKYTIEHPRDQEIEIRV